MEFKEKILKYKPYLIYLAIILGLITFNIYTLTLVQKDENTEEVIKIKPKNKSSAQIKVDIKGAVNNIGVYEMENGSRVIDLIDKAGGITKEADTSLINLSKKLEDEMVIIIYSKAEVNKIKNENQTKKITSLCPKENNACPEKEPETLETKTSSKNSDLNTKISINNATVEELQKLNGIGKSKAEAIVEYRTENGEFKKIEDIKKVSGIGDSAFEKIKDKITV